MKPNTNLIEKAQANIAKAQAQLEELLAQDKAWHPRDTDFYWFLRSDGTTDRGTWQATDDTKRYLDQGNIFRTKEEAEKERDRRAVLKKVRDIAASDGWVPDWTYRSSVVPYSLIWDYADTEWQICSHSYIRGPQPGTVYMSEASAHKCIEELGDELDALLY